MSAIAAGVSGDGHAATFRPLTVTLMILVGIAAFATTLVLGAYAPDFKASRSGATHAQSTGATGFSGLFRLLEATGRSPTIVRSEEGYETGDLLVLSPPDGVTSVSAAVGSRDERPTLMILPKWATQADPDHSGWVRASGLAPRFVPQGVLAPATKLTVTRVRGASLLRTDTEIYDRRTGALARFVAPRVLQTIRGGDLRPIITDADGRIVLGELGSSQFYVLADPDLLANVAIDDRQAAQAALALIDFLGPDAPDGVAFDVLLHGLGQRPNPLQLALEPPFLAMALALVAVLLLVACQAFGRFGPARVQPRAIAFGKAALVDNSAALIAKAGREGGLGARYVAVVRERARLAFGVPAQASTQAADAYLDRIDRRGRFTTLASDATRADDPQTVLAAAQALHDWQGERTT